MATKNRTNAYVQLNSEQPAPLNTEVIRDVLEKVSSASDVKPFSDLTVEERFARDSTQVNVDLAQAALCEVEEGISLDNFTDGFYDLEHADAYQTVRWRFINDATRKGHTYALQAAMWRAYSAGRCSPERIVPRSRKEREDAREQ